MSCRPRFLPALPFGLALLLASCTAVAAAAPAAIRLPAEQARALGVRNAAAVAATGIPLELERHISAAFIRGEDYGTRASTIVAIDHAGHGFIHERRFGPQGVFNGETRMDL